MNSQITNAISITKDYVNCQQRFAQVQGFLHALEGYTLMQLAAHGGGTGAIVEIGSYMGRSTAFLAAGSKNEGRERVTAVDHFGGSAEHQAGQQFESPAVVQNGTTFQAFQENLRRLGLDDYVMPIMADSATAVRNWTEPIRLLFIDGDHSYESCSQDFALWSPFIAMHGVVCFHDVDAPSWPGVTRFFKELMQQTKAYRSVLSVKSLRVIERVA